jgi:P-type Ca2+ transporter type 2C
MQRATPQPPAPAPSPWHALPVGEAARALETDLQRGLSAAEARARLERYGPNQLQEKGGRHWLQMVADQFKDVVIWVLLIAVVISALLGELTDAVVIVVIVLLNAVLGVVQESKAERSLEALKRMAAPHARAVRDGQAAEIRASDLVPGDVVLLEAGNFIPADLRLVEAASLRVEEASLTGESVPVEKRAESVLEPDTETGDRVNLAYAGTTVAVGRGKGLVTATGTHTELGQIARMLGEVEAERTPLQERLDGLGRSLAALVLGVCVVVFAAGWLRGRSLLEMFLTAVSLAVAAIPEGLTAVVTIVLALGMGNMVRRHVIVRRLRAVEALGSITVICTDKTGTLTQNEMTVRCFLEGEGRGSLTGGGYVPEGDFRRGDTVLVPLREPALRRMLEIAALCNDASLRRGDGGWTASGDPTEVAILVAASKAGLQREELEREMPRRGEVPFDSDRKRMSTLHELPGRGFRVMVKGAPDELLRCCTRAQAGDEIRPLEAGQREEIERASREFAEQALRVLGFAYLDLPGPPREMTPDIERDLVFAGLMGMIDPPRQEAADAVRLCQRAGIRPVMITGDYPATADAIGRELGITDGRTAALAGAELRKLSDEELRRRADEVAIYARVSPADKLRIVEAHQQNGQIVAMTGDGVNDAPALKRADIGVAMGIAGTDVAKGAADIVLTDDNFASIVAAVEEGRGIFDNIRKFVFYLLSCNISEVLTIFISIMAGLPQPLLPVQILWVNLVTDGLPALALGMEPKEPGLMDRPPRDPREGVLTGETVRGVLWYGGFITLATLAAYAHGLYWYCLVPQGHAGLEALAQAFRPEFWQSPGMEPGLLKARTLAFGTLAYSQLAHALNSRSERLSLLRLKPWTNPHLLAAIGLSILAQLLVIYMPLANRIFETVPITGRDLLVGGVLSVSPLFFGEVRKWLLGRRELRRVPAGGPGV